MAWVNLLTVGSPYTYTLNNSGSLLEISSGYLQTAGYPTEVAANLFADDEGNFGYESSWYPATDQSLTITVPTGTQIRASVVAHSTTLSSGNIEAMLVRSADEANNDSDPNYGWILDPGGSPGYSTSNDYTAAPVALSTSLTYPYARFFISAAESPSGTIAARFLIEVETEDFDEFWTDEINATETV